MSRSLLLSLATVIALGLTTSTASAASLTITPKDTKAPDTITVPYSGTADVSSYLKVYGAKDETSCAPSQAEYMNTHDPAGPNAPASSVDEFVPAGPFSGALDLQPRGQQAPGRYQLCAYLSPRDASAPATVASGSLVYSAAQAAARTFTNNLFERKNGVMVLTYGPRSFTVNAPGDVAATLEVSVSAATKSRYNLPSAVIIKGSTSREGEWKAKSTVAVARKLKGVKKLAVTYTLRYTSPVAETITRKLTLYSAGSATNSNVKLVRLSSSGDTAKEQSEDGDGDGGRGGRG